MQLDKRMGGGGVNTITLSEIIIVRFRFCFHFTIQIFHLLTQHTIEAFKFRAQANFSLLEKTLPPGSQNLSSKIFYYYFTL